MSAVQRCAESRRFMIYMRRRHRLRLRHRHRAAVQTHHTRTLDALLGELITSARGLYAAL